MDVPCNFTLETYACVKVIFNVVFTTAQCQNFWNESLPTVRMPQIVILGYGPSPTGELHSPPVGITPEV